MVEAVLGEEVLEEVGGFGDGGEGDGGGGAVEEVEGGGGVGGGVLGLYEEDVLAGG